MQNFYEERKKAGFIHRWRTKNHSICVPTAGAIYLRFQEHIRRPYDSSYKDF